jgi:hypothetical protein
MYAAMGVYPSPPAALPITEEVDRIAKERGIDPGNVFSTLVDEEIRRLSKK